MKGFLVSWQPWALLSAAFAALTAIFASVGIASGSSDFTPLIRTIVVVGVLGLFLTVTQQWQSPFTSSAKTYVFLMLSGLATGASWV